MKLKQIKPNMTQVTMGMLEILFSYETPVACFDHNSGKAKKTSKKWSKTTSRHINSWFDQRKDIEEVDQDFFDNLIR